MVKILKFASTTSAKNLDVEDLGDIDYFLTDPISNVWPKQMRIQLLTKKKPHDYFPVGPLRLGSSKFIDACRNFNVNAEFLPVQLLGKDGNEIESSFYVCHLLENVDCFDSKKSKCIYRDEEKTWIDELIDLVIDAKRASGHHLFRIDIPAFIIGASDEFAEAAHRLGLSGTVFIDPADWSGVSC